MSKSKPNNKKKDKEAAKDSGSKDKFSTEIMNEAIRDVKIGYISK